MLLLELALEKESDQHLNNYRLSGGGSGGHGKGYQGSRPGQGTTPKHAHARIMENVKDYYYSGVMPGTSKATSSTPLTASSETASWSRGSSRRRTPAPKRSCRIITGAPSRVHSAGSGSTTRMSATISNAYRRSLGVKILAKAQAKVEAKAKATTPARASRKDVVKGKDKGQGGRGGGANRQPDKDNKNEDKNRGNPNPNPGDNSEPSGAQFGPTTSSQTQAQQEQGAKREHEGGDDGNAKKRRRFMTMARKLRNKGFEVTCPAEF